MPNATNTAISAAGSNRQYSRRVAPDGTTYIHVVGVSRQENHAFITMARHFEKLGLPTPRLLWVSEDEMQYDQEDLGNTLLFDDLRPDLLRKTVHALRRLNEEGARGMDWSVCYPVDSMNRRSIMWDLNYWKYCYLKLTGIEILENALEDDFERLADRLLREPQDCFMMRDCQSRNVMIKTITPLEGEPEGVSVSGEVYFIDFQGGRRGPKYYDIVSLLWQAKANLPQELREEMLAEYGDLDRATVDHFVLFRTLQVLGAYGFRGLHERKQHFIDSIPFALNNLRTLFASNSELRTMYPYIYKISTQPCLQ